MSNTRDEDPFDEIIESNVQDAAPESLIINASDAIESNRLTHMNIHRTFVTVTLSNYFISHATRIISTGSRNWTSKKPHQKAFIYGIDGSDTVKAMGVEID